MIFGRFVKTVMGLSLGLALVISCSKKDVVQDEPAISPSPSTPADAGTAPGGEGVGVGTAGAGDSAASAGNELQTAYFDFDSFQLRKDARDALKFDADWLRKSSGATVQVEGHCDERGTTEYNLALGEKRANAARDYLVKLGVNKSRVSVISYGKERPADPGHTEDSWGKNRRAQFVILSK